MDETKTEPAQSIVERVDGLDRSTAWALLEEVAPEKAYHVSEHLDGDYEPGEPPDEDYEDQVVRETLCAVLDDLPHGVGHALLDAAYEAQERRREAKREALEALAQEREEEVPEWVRSPSWSDAP